MIIKVLEKYKSLKPFDSEELSDFVVVTGKNGSGKSQLIQLIQHLSNDHSGAVKNIKIEPLPTNIQVEGITFQNVQILESSKATQQLHSYYSSYTSIQPEVKLLIKELLENGLDPYTLSLDFNVKPFIKNVSEETKDEWIISFVGQNINSFYDPNRKRMYTMSITMLAQHLFQFRNTIIAATEVCNYRHKSFLELEKSDFTSTPISEISYTTNSPFSIQIEHLFYGYARRRLMNEIDYNRKINYQKENKAISDKEFIEMFPPPWSIINSILEKHNLKLRINEILQEDFSLDYDYSAKLVDITTNDKITFEELSSGEKIIVGLIIRLFLTDTYKNKLAFPNLIVFDEPDAYLHPQISLLLLEVLYETFVKELGIKVIITTHSPSTVALAPV